MSGELFVVEEAVLYLLFGHLAIADPVVVVLHNRQFHPDEYVRAKKDAKLALEKLETSMQEAEGRIVAVILQNSDKQMAEASGGKHNYDIRDIVGC
ncbi:hypothetical protein [Burkholderia ubonensis]|uniref:hypothetical protein n=1 Tax=Burkholderia ubonensis TaxID=101571 RepID=UPI0012F7E6B6|nr:hypothetical protein [Burkholderia ubonensis]